MALPQHRTCGACGAAHVVKEAPLSHHLALRHCIRTTMHFANGLLDGAINQSCQTWMGHAAHSGIRIHRCVNGGAEAFCDGHMRTEQLGNSLKDERRGDWRGLFSILVWNKPGERALREHLEVIKHKGFCCEALHQHKKRYGRSAAEHRQLDGVGGLERPVLSEHEEKVEVAIVVAIVRRLLQQRFEQGAHSDMRVMCEQMREGALEKDPDDDLVVVLDEREAQRAEKRGRRLDRILVAAQGKILEEARHRYQRGQLHLHLGQSGRILERTHDIPRGCVFRLACRCIQRRSPSQRLMDVDSQPMKAFGIKRPYLGRQLQFAALARVFGAVDCLAPVQASRERANEWTGVPAPRATRRAQPGQGRELSGRMESRGGPHLRRGSVASLRAQIRCTTQSRLCVARGVMTSQPCSEDGNPSLCWACARCPPHCT
eukprot:scaffold2499_cov129-Isochrysis_galbana.AAC.3